jgi:predicted transcriptional regulator
MVMEDKTIYKEKLKPLRQERTALVEHTREQIKTNNKLFKKIKSQIKDQAMTIPQISAAIEEPSSTVLVYVAGLKKFGLVVEKEKDGDYFKYQLSSTD